MTFLEHKTSGTGVWWILRDAPNI